MVALMVILTMLGFIAIDGIVQHVQAKRLADVPAAKRDQAPVAPVNLTTPGGIFLSPQHTWLQIRENGRVRVGMDGLIAGLLGRINGVTLASKGSVVKAGQPVCSVHLSGRKLDLVAPVAGIVKSVNPEVTEQPESALSRPYSGWLCELDAIDLGNEVKSLRIGEQALDWLRAEAQQVSEFLMRKSAPEPALGLVLADGGIPRQGALETLEDADWHEFQTRFLAPEQTHRP
ncbi:MAG: hypothetical protein WAO20_19055 [Acidobacteriota bacterium]